MATHYHYEKKQARFPLQFWTKTLAIGLVIGGVLAVLVRTWVYRPIQIDSSAMEPTLLAGKTYHAWVWQPKNLRIGDIVLCRRENSVVVSRILGKPGDRIQIDHKSVIRNGEILPNDLYPAIWKDDRPSLPSHLTSRDRMDPIRIPENQYFLLGDNRDESMDSRSFGPVPADCIFGVISH